MVIVKQSTWLGWIPFLFLCKQFSIFNWRVPCSAWLHLHGSGFTEHIDQIEGVVHMN